MYAHATVSFLALIREVQAKADEVTVEKIKEDRGGGKGNPSPCIHRDRPVQDNLDDFEKMKRGDYPEKAACLRMKMNLESGNPYMWDTIAYRVKLSPHHRTGDKWSK